MDDTFSTMSKRIKQRAVVEFLAHESETPVGILRRLLAFHVEDTVDVSTLRRWVIKSRDSGGNLVLNDHPRSGRSVSATDDLNRQNVDEVIQENGQKLR
jgi:hypothetical protein